MLTAKELIKLPLNIYQEYFLRLVDNSIDEEFLAMVKQYTEITKFDKEAFRKELSRVLRKALKAVENKEMSPQDMADIMERVKLLEPFVSSFIWQKEE